MGTTMLLVCAFGMKTTMNYFIDWQFKTIDQFAYQLDLKPDITEGELSDIYEKYGEASSMRFGVEMEDKRGGKCAKQLLINDADGLLNFTDHEGKVQKISDDGIYLSEKLLEELGYQVGDSVKWSPYGQDDTYSTKIAGTFREPQGQGAGMTRKCAENIGLTYRPNSIYTMENLDGVQSVVGVSMIQNIEMLKDGMVSMLDVMNSVIAMLGVVSVVLAFVIIYNLGTMSFTEKEYQFATMKVLGFRYRNIRRIYMMQNNWVAVAGILFGLPFGFWMTQFIFTMAIGDTYDMMVYIPPYLYVTCAAATFVVSFLINQLLGRKARKIDMVSSLKANE